MSTEIIAATIDAAMNNVPGWAIAKKFTQEATNIQIQQYQARALQRQMFGVSMLQLNMKLMQEIAAQNADFALRMMPWLPKK